MAESKETEKGNSMSHSTNDIHRITPQELDARLQRGERIMMLDVRRRDKWAVKQGGIPGAMWIPLEEVPQRARDLPRDAQIITYCS
jgi:rhodanese-related sulfurtransferase